MLPRIPVAPPRWLGWVALGLNVGFPLLGGLLAAHFTDLGRDWDPNFYIVFAQVLPVLLVAAVVESGVAFRVLLEQATEKEAARRQVAFTLRGQVTLFALGEGVLLYAVANAISTPFLVSVAGLCALTYLADLVIGMNRRLGVIEWELVSLPKKRREAIARLAERSRERAARMTAQADALEKELNSERGEPSAPRHG